MNALVSEFPIKIDHGLKIPEKHKKRVARFPWRQMKVGDSILLPDEDSKNAAYAAGKRLGMKFTCRKTDEGFRAWRVA